MQPSLPERALHRKKLIVAAILVVVVTVCSVYILAGGGTGMSSIAMSAQTGPAGALLAGNTDFVYPEVWSWNYAVTILVMWWLMMVAMMLPGAAPTILLYGALRRSAGVTGMLEFAAGYLAVWAVFSIAATASQAALASVALISAMYMNVTTQSAAAAILVTAGAYQLSPIKQACLIQCREPEAALVRFRRTGRAASFRMGWVHGTYCLGCCWAIMALLFVGGIMNIWWILGTAIFVAVEKLAPGGRYLSWILGGSLILAGVTLFFRQT